MRPLSVLIRPWLHLQAEGIGVVLGNSGWHDTVVPKALVEAEIFHRADGRGVAFVPLASLRKPACPEWPPARPGPWIPLGI